MDKRLFKQLEEGLREAIDHARAAKSKPVPSYLLPKPDPIILNRDFDKIPEAEDEAISWVGKGHILETDIPRGN